jgi:hypothetical protein
VIVITGPGRSGTSFLADLYRKLRFDPGGGWDKDIRAGLEDAEIVEVNTEICRELKAPVGPPPKPSLGEQRWDRVSDLAERFGPKLREIASRREVSKDPRFVWTMRVWLEAEAAIDHVVLTFRRVDDVIESAQFAGMGQPKENVEQVNQSRSTIIYRMGSVLTAVGEHKTPYSLLWFPDYLSDPDALFDSLVFPRPVDRGKFINVFRKTVNLDHVHFGAKAPRGTA